MINRALLMICTITSCGAEQLPDFIPVEIQVADEFDKPVPGVQVFLDGLSGPTTNKQGISQLRAKGPGNRKVRVDIECPHNQRATQGTSRDILLQYLKPLNGYNDNLHPVQTTFKCESTSLAHVVVVRTDLRADLPIIMLGAERARTDDQGIAQFAFAGSPGEEVEVVIDTSTNKNLRPSMPKRRFRIPNDSQILLFDQDFEVHSQTKERTALKRFSRPQRL